MLPIIALRASLSFYQVYCPWLSSPMTIRKSIDKVAKLLDLLDKHIKEKNCHHSSKDLLSEYEKLMGI